MASKIVDARMSQNASLANSIAIPILVINTPQLFGQVGLNTYQTNSSNVHVTFQGVVSVQLPLALVGVTITVVRGTMSTDPVVYSATSTYSLSVLAPQIIAFSGGDYNPPAANQTTYTAFISSNILGTIRVGPESFSAAAYYTDSITG